MAYQHNQKPSKCDHMHVVVNNNWACPQLRNMAAQLARLALRSIDFTELTSCPVVQIEPSSC